MGEQHGNNEAGLTEDAADVTADAGSEEEFEFSDDAQSDRPEEEAIEGNDIDLIEIELQFELGKVRMTLAELRTMDAGTIVMLDGGSPESVAIIASGQLLGYGELVDVEGRIGIRITEWGNDNDRPA